MAKELIQLSETEIKKARLYQLQAVLNRMQKNINLLDAPPNVKTITVINGSLFKIALDEYGDADYWTVIADANNIQDPYLTGEITLIIPPKPSTDPGGVPSG